MNTRQTCHQGSTVRLVTLDVLQCIRNVVFIDTDNQNPQMTSLTILDNNK